MILGLTGKLCAGTDTLAEIFRKEKGFVFISYSDILREELLKRGIELTRENLQDLGDELRKKDGLGALSKIIAEKILTQPEKNYVVGNIRNPGEVEEMKKIFSENFVLVKIEAEQKIRFERLLQRRREKDPETFEDFVKVEERDVGKNQPAHGQQHDAVFSLVEMTIENNGSFEQLREKAMKLLENINC